TFVTSYADTGFFGVYTGTGEKESAEMVNVIRGELARFAASATEEELARTRTQAISSLRMSRESTSSEVDTLGRHLLNYGRVIPIEEVVEKIEAVTLADIRRVIEDVLATKEAMVALGPVKNVEKVAA
ncbi:MAG: insulinase family protein, partial [Alphaproteobacteria bacterium]|nr:insulinase family protein [Alphaproteobacteria bacterium]